MYFLDSGVAYNMTFFAHIGLSACIISDDRRGAL